MATYSPCFLLFVVIFFVYMFGYQMLHKNYVCEQCGKKVRKLPFNRSQDGSNLVEYSSDCPKCGSANTEELSTYQMINLPKSANWILYLLLVLLVAPINIGVYGLSKLAVVGDIFEFVSRTDPASAVFPFIAIIGFIFFFKNSNKYICEDCGEKFK